MQGKKWALVAMLVAGTLAATLPLAAQDDPPSRVARIDRMQGDVSLMYPGYDGWTEAPANYPLVSGARIYSGDYPSQVEIQSGGTEVRGWNDTDITLTNLMDGYEQIALASGSIRVSIYSMNPDDLVEIDTPNGAVMLQQPGSYRIDAYPDNGASDLVVSSGLAVVAAPGGLNQEVGQGQAVQLFGSNPTDLEPTGFPPPDGLDSWSAGLDYGYHNSISIRYVSPYMVGYGDLDANGNWAQEGEYGPVWYPNVDPAWRPYSVGHWAYVAPWGYTWIDDAPWGYAPFHYGRWVVVRGRWGWVPGPREVRPVYSPALVAFVGGAQISIGGGGVAAWFPLGVGEPYVPWYHCSPRYAVSVNVSNVNVAYIHNTTVANNFNVFVTNTRTVTNVTNITVNNITYVNRTQVVVVPAAAMTSGHSVAQAQIRVTPDVQRQLAAAPVHAAPSAPAPARPLLVAKTSVKAPVAPPTVLTPRGPAKATPQATPVTHAPAPLPKPQPAAALAKPKPGAVAGRPPVARPAQPTPVQNVQPVKPQAPSRPVPPPTISKPASPPIETKPAPPTETQPVPRPVPPPRPNQPAMAPKPTPPPSETRPAAPPVVTRPTPPAAATRPAPTPPPPTPRPENKPAPPPVLTRPAPTPPPPAPKPETKPAPNPPAKPAVKQPPPKKNPEEKKPEEKPQ
jgi:hypothetical protein